MYQIIDVVFVTLIKMSKHTIENPSGMLNIKTNTLPQYLCNYGCFYLDYERFNPTKCQAITHLFKLCKIDITA